MYVFFGFLLLFFSSVHGEIIQCFVGGIVKYDTNNANTVNMQKELCNKLLEDMFGILYSINKYDWSGILNNPLDFAKYLVNNDLPSSFVVKNIVSYYAEMTTKAGLRPIENTGDYCKNYSNKFHETYSIKLLQMDKSIVEYWDEIVEMGTDIHRLKFHSKLLDMHFSRHEFTAEEILVYLKSSYSVVGIYYLTNNILVARSVSRETVFIYKLYEHLLLGSNINKMEIEIWKWLTQIAQIEMEDLSIVRREYRIDLKNRLKETINNIKYLLSTEENYTCSYLFFFRSVLLDISLLSKTILLEECASLIKTNLIMNCDNHMDNNKYQLYMNTISSMYEPEVENIRGLTSFYHLINALKIPVFTSEDRLLNYKVTVMAMKKISDCVNQNVEWLEYENNCLCNTLKENRQIDEDLNDILTKLTYMQVYQMIDDGTDFIPGYLNNDETIDENKLHMIVTMALDNMNTTFDSSSKRIIIVEETIQSLTNYVNHLKSANSNVLELIRALKWLVELYGVLCTDSDNETDIKNYQRSLEKLLERAIKLKRKYHIEDDHLDFLFYKKICKDSQLSYSWERHYNADGWIQKLPDDSDKNNSDSIFQGCDCNGVNAFLNINNQFINKADVNILLFKHLMKTYYNDDSISKFVKEALSYRVVTSEDRVRNLQAHDLYSMYFVWGNYRIAKEKENI